MKWLKMSIIVTRSAAFPIVPWPSHIAIERGREASLHRSSPRKRESRLFERISHHGLSMHGEPARDADGLAGDVCGVIGQQEGDEPGIIFRHAQPPHRDGALEPFGDARAVGAFQKT